jgi:hypothetical protein
MKMCLKLWNGKPWDLCGVILKEKAKGASKVINSLQLVGTRDDRTQSTLACKLALLHLAFRTWVLTPRYLALRTSINGHWVSFSRPEFQDLDIWLSGLGFQDLDIRTDIGHRKLSILRSSYLFPVTFLCVQ